MEGLFARLRTELVQLRQLLSDRVIDITVPMGAMTHARMLETLNDMFVSNEPALALFLAYPTRRLWSPLIKAAADAATAVAWLAQNPPTDSTVTALTRDYAACCERLQSGIADWRLSVDLKRVEYDLDLGPREMVH
jgi:hypothetical protein